MSRGLILRTLLTPMVQGVTSWTMSAIMMALSRSRILSMLPQLTKRTVAMTFYATSLQAILGMSTLIYMVPIELAAAHQANGVLVLSALVATFTSLKRPSAQTRILPLNSLSKFPASRTILSPSLMHHRPGSTAEVSAKLERSLNAMGVSAHMPLQTTMSGIIAQDVTPWQPSSLSSSKA